MSESRQIDGELQELEERLRATLIALPGQRRDQLLYACGKTAGRLDARRVTRRWTGGAAAAGVLAGALLMAVFGTLPAPESQRRELVGKRRIEAPAATPESQRMETARPFLPGRGQELVGRSSNGAHPTEAPGQPKQLSAGLSFYEALLLFDRRPPLVDLKGVPNEATTAPLQPLSTIVQ